MKSVFGLKLDVFPEREKKLGDLLFLGDIPVEWQFTAYQLNKHYRLIVPEVPYDKFKDIGSELSKYIIDIVSLLDIDQFSFISHSMGALAALHLTTLFPEKVNSLTLINLITLDAKFLSAYFTTEEAELEKTLSLLNNYPEASIDRAGLRKSISNIINQNLCTFSNYLDPGFSRTALSKFYGPILFIYGENDKKFSIDKARQWKACMGDQLQLEVMKHCGHYPMVDNSVYFNYLVENFLYEKVLNVA